MRVRTLLLMVGDTLHPVCPPNRRDHREILEDASSEEEEEGQVDEDGDERSSSSQPSGSQGWGRDAEMADWSAPQHGFSVCLGLVNVRGWA